jgi:hypothetical protein
MGRMVLTVLGMVAEMELSFIRDRQRVGIDAAKAKGVYKGRPTTFDRARIVALRKEGMGATEIARAVGCSGATSTRRSRPRGSTRCAGEQSPPTPLPMTGPVPGGGPSYVGTRSRQTTRLPSRSDANHVSGFCLTKRHRRETLTGIPVPIRPA